MKTSIYLLLTTAIAALAASCGSDTVVIESEAKQPVTVRATTEYTSVPATRTLFGQAEPISDGSTIYSIPLTWGDPKDERINAVSFSDNGMPTGTLAIFEGVETSLSDDGKSMSFTGTYSDGGFDNKTAYVYPAGQYTTWTTIDNVSNFAGDQTQTGNDKITHLHALNRMYSELVDRGAPFALHPLGAILRFDLTFDDVETISRVRLYSTVACFIKSVSIDYAGGSASVTVAAPEYQQRLYIEEFTGSRLIAYMMVGAVEGFEGLQEASLSIQATAIGGYYIKQLGTTKSDAYWKPGTCYNFTIGADDWSKE